MRDGLLGTHLWQARQLSEIRKRSFAYPEKSDPMAGISKDTAREIGREALEDAILIQAMMSRDRSAEAIHSQLKETSLHHLTSKYQTPQPQKLGSNCM